MKGEWYCAAALAIEQALATLPANPTKAQIEAAVRDAYPFGERRMHPYKQWLKARATILRQRYPGHFADEPRAWPEGSLFKGQMR